MRFAATIKERDRKWRHEIDLNIVYMKYDEEKFQKTFINKTIKDSLKISIHAYLAMWQ